MRKHGRTDSNQSDIVKALRKAGATVQSLADVGGGCPDLLVGYFGYCILFEVKDGTLPPSGRKLTPKEKAWHKSWNGQVDIVETAEEAIAALRRLTEPDPPAVELPRSQDFGTEPF